MDEGCSSRGSTVRRPTSSTRRAVAWGPSGMVYNPGTALPRSGKKHFMVSTSPSPANAKIYAFTLKEDGAGFALDNEKVLLGGILTVP